MNTAVLIVSHEIRSTMAAESFRSLVARVASRLPEVQVAGAQLDAAGADIREVAGALLQAGAVRLLLLPYFLHKAAHAAMDLPHILSQLADQYPGVRCEVLDGLWDEPLIEDALFERVAGATTDPEQLPELGADIERRSHEIIDRRLTWSSFTLEEKAVARRIIHATADFSFAETLRFHPEATARAILALRSGRPVICDVNMLKSGITRTAGIEVICAVGEPEVAAAAQEKGCTRAAAAMDHLLPLLDGAIIAVGNAPTAIWRLLELPVHPAVVIGLPVGLVGAREAKQALIASERVYIANTSPRGGSPAAAAAVNALALLARMDDGE